MSMKHPTTRDIAAASGFSPATVSHALRNNPKISPATRNLIHDVAKRLGWRPNPLVSAYMAHFRAAHPATYQAGLAYLLSNPASGRMIDQPLHIRLHYEGAQQRARELGYGIESIWLHEPHLTAKRLNNILSSRNIRGVLVPGEIQPRDLFKDLDWSPFAAVALGFSPSKSMLHRVTVDTNAGFMMMLRRARELKYRRIAVVVSEEYDDKERQGVLQAACYLREQWSREKESCELLLCHFKTAEAHEMEGIARWLRQHRPDAILGEEITWQTIRHMGWRIPQDVAFMSADCSVEFPLVGGFNQRHDLYGGVAVEMLAGQISQNLRGLPDTPRVTLVTGSWTDGLSIPPREDIPRLKMVANP
jgi:DNA-binding LacI/PurR family transcriptional regulator